MTPPQPEPARRKRNRRILIVLWLIVIALAMLVPLVVNLPDYAHQAAGPVRIKKVLEAQVEAWNREDLEGYMAGYWKSDNLEFHGGKKEIRGWQATLDNYRAKYQGEGKEMGHLKFTDLQIEMNSSSEATVTGRWQLTMKDDSKPRGGFTLKFRRFEDQWKIVKDVTTSDP